VGPADLHVRISSAQAVIDRAKDKKPWELSDAVAGDIQFPGRDESGLLPRESKSERMGKKALRIS